MSALVRVRGDGRSQGTPLSAIDRLHVIVAGIDQREDPGIDHAWWETSTGAEFGAQKLAELEQLVRDLTAEGPQARPTGERS